MQTSFSPAQLADPAIATSAQAIRKCVHCGFCLATCPTYVLLGDELDSPRGRIYLIKDLLEQQRAPTAEVVTHLDRCLTCLSCTTTCPSEVDYRHLVDHAHAYIERHYRRPASDRLLRWMLAAVLPYPRRFRAMLALARLGRPFGPLLRRLGLRRLAGMLALATDPAPAAGPPPDEVPRPRAGVMRGGTAAQGRVILLEGCVEGVVEPRIRAAAARLLALAQLDVAAVRDEGCCGALVHHLGRERASREAAKRNIDAWSVELERDDLVAIVTTASGCGAHLDDYGFLLRDDAQYAARAARVSALAQDISEVLAARSLPAPVFEPGLKVAYHAACSLQHGQKVHRPPRGLLRAAGFELREIPEGHLCCGSAGTYNLLQPDIATRLRERKLDNITTAGADVIAAGNIGCLRQLAAGATMPVVHTVELLDWAMGGPVPPPLWPAVERRR